MSNLSADFMHAPGTANTVAQVVLGAGAGGGPGIPLTIVQIEWGYDIDPGDGSPGFVEVLQGATLCKKMPVTSKGAGFHPFPGGLKPADGQSMTVRLTAVAGAVGYINVTPEL